MSFLRAFTIISFSIALFFSSGPIPKLLGANPLPPHVSPSMEKPEFWTKKVQKPTHLLLKPEQIQRMNEENLKKQDLLLCRVKDLKQEWTREEFLALLREDWQGFGDKGEIRFGREGRPLGKSFWEELRKNFNSESIQEQNRILYGLIVKRADIRVFPTDELSLSSPEQEFDRFQHSMISPGALVGIYHFSKDDLWAYIQTGFIRGWVHKDRLAIAKEKIEALDYDEAKDRLVITGSFVRVFYDPSFQQEAFVAQMGASFPLPGSEGQGMDGQSYTIKIPFREKDGQLTFRNGYIPKGEDVHLGYLPFIQMNIAKQAFKMLDQPYGWGEMSGGRDCSRFIMDLFAPFGILMPRNSMLQAKVGIDLGQIEGKALKEKRKVLDRAVPFVTTLRLPGHIMLYLGKYRGRWYVIHSLWGYQKKGEAGPSLEKVARVVVSDLSLGGSGPNGSLFQRLTDIRFIGGEKDSSKSQISP